VLAVDLGDPRAWAAWRNGVRSGILGQVESGSLDVRGKKGKRAWMRCGDERVGVRVVRRGSRGARFRAYSSCYPYSAHNHNRFTL